MANLTDATYAVIWHAQRTRNVRLTVEQTGGGCTALVAPLEGDRVLVLTTPNLDADTVGDVSDVLAGIYTAEAWQDGGEPLQHVGDYVTALQALDVLLPL